MKIAVIGSGISGLAAAWMLQPKHDVHLLEGARRLGGHTNTHDVPTDAGRIAVDSGFIVYNEETYPHLTRLFDLLEVESRPTNMSFSLSCSRCDLVYSGLGAGGVFADPRNAVRPGFLAFLLAIQRFHTTGRSASTSRALGLGAPGGPNSSAREGGLPMIAPLDLAAAPLRSSSSADLENLVSESSNAGPLGRHYVFPLASALWSTGIPHVRRLPAHTFVDFFRRHRLFQIRDRLEWRTVVGGSRTYIQAMGARLDGRTHTGRGVRSIERGSSRVRLHLEDGGSQEFDRVVIATHADEALRMLAEPTDAERELLGAWRYETSDTWLHSDPSYLDPRPSAQASWNYHLADCRNPAPAPTMTYNLNRLQGLETEVPYLVTLNPDSGPEQVHARMTYTHPIFTVETVATQEPIAAMNGEEATYFCGAHLGFGFHEDGLRSAVEVAEQLGGRLQ